MPQADECEVIVKASSDSNQTPWMDSQNSLCWLGLKEGVVPSDTSREAVTYSGIYQ